MREIEWVGDCSVLILYNNNPYDCDPIARDRELADFRRWMEGKDMWEAGYAEYPRTGKDEGYSYAVLVECDPGQAGWVEEKYFALLFTRLRPPSPPGPSDAGE